MLKYTGSAFLGQRLLLSTLSGRPLRVTRIREDAAEPGLADWEASLVRLLDKVTDGAKIKINDTGTELRYRPGQIVGGEGIVHQCPPSRCVTYYLEILAVLALFAKSPLSVTLRGVTNDDRDVCVDTFRTGTLPLLRHAGADEGLVLEVKRRGLAPSGGGEVLFKCGCVKAIRPLNLLEEGKVKRVRGVAWTARVSPQFAARVVDAARNLLNDFLPDVWIYTDHAKGNAVAEDRGYGISLVAETIKGHLKTACFQADLAAPDSAEGRLASPEALGTAVAARLLQEIELGGVADSTHQWLLVMLAAVSAEDQPSRLRLGRLAGHTVAVLRHLRDFLGLSFQFQADGDAVLLTTVGVGLANMAKKTF